MDCERCKYYWNNGKDECCDKRGWDFKRNGCPDFASKYKPKTNADSFRVEEAYNWRGDIMEITRRIVHETDEARLNNIAEHFMVDLSEIREFLEMKRKKTQKPFTNYDLLIRKTPEELAGIMVGDCPPNYPHGDCREYEKWDGNLDCPKCWLNWLKQEADNE